MNARCFELHAAVGFANAFGFVNALFAALEFGGVVWPSAVKPKCWSCNGSKLKKRVMNFAVQPVPSTRSSKCTFFLPCSRQETMSPRVMLQPQNGCPAA
jgi:hypothetical protein